MRSLIRTAAGCMRRGAESVVAALLAIMFVAFLVQIAFRYFLNFPIGWSSELSVITWLYMVLLGSAFWLRSRSTLKRIVSVVSLC